jgi:phosphoglycolate phosphatase-like HAD superfamily hydrolase
VLTGGAGVRAMARAFEELFAITNPFGGLSPAGRTDAWILAELAVSHQLADRSRELSRFRQIYLKYLAAEIGQPGPRKGVLPGVRPLLDTLSGRPDIHLALLTGNYREGARTKLEHFDLWRYFCGGAFGDVALDRNALVHEALASVVACGGPSVDAADAVIIGDTPLDVASALTSGTHCIAVATGTSSVDALRAAGADVVFSDLSDTAAVVATIDKLTSTTA